MDIVAARSFSTMYIYLDIVFLVLFASFLIIKRRYLTLLFGLAGGLLYFAVDYGIFHLLTGSRSIQGGSMFWVLLWMSMSYGFTNFAWIWLCLDKSKNLVQWTALILCWWIACPMLASTFGASMPVIKISRTTGSYHGIMALILMISYFAVITYNLCIDDNTLEISIPRLCLIGIAVQLGWEFSLLLGGIRSNGMNLAEQLRVLTVNSLLETNLGMPAIYLIYLAVTAKSSEDLRRRSFTLADRLRENNAKRVSEPSADPA